MLRMGRHGNMQTDRPVIAKFSAALTHGPNVYLSQTVIFMVFIHEMLEFHWVYHG